MDGGDSKPSATPPPRAQSSGPPLLVKGKKKISDSQQALTMAANNSPTTTLPLAGRGAIVTGASRGIGRAIALHLASLGARLVINYFSSSHHADLLAAELNSSSPSSPPCAVAIRADISDPAQVSSLFDQAESFFSTPPHILVACAGVHIGKFPSLADTTVEDWDSTFAINTRGAFLCCREAANRLRRGGGGRIVTVSSSLVGVLRPGYAAYTASKAAVEAMTRILARELRGTGITANCVAPGPVATDLFLAGKSEEDVRQAVQKSPLERLGKPEDVSALVGFLCTDAGEWVDGQVVRVNGCSV